MCDDVTIIYITDNVLDKRLFKACKQHLLKASENKRLITVSHKPLKFGENICVGDIGRSGYSISRQIKAGLDLVDTKFVAIAEHDCVYSSEHFSWTPPDEEYFYYNTNCWLLQYQSKKRPAWNGTFSIRWRRVQSQLIASTAQMLKAVDHQLDILGDPKIREMWPGYARLGEPGVYPKAFIHKSFRRRQFVHKIQEAEKYATSYTAKTFKTQIPNIDVRHNDNISGQRRGTRRRRRLRHWGTMEDILNV